MAWTVPRSWVPGEMVNAALLNQYVRDNLNFLRNQVGAKIIRPNAAGNQSIPNSANTSPDFTATEFDTDSMADLVNDRLNINTGGKYVIGACFNFASQATGNRMVRIYYRDSAAQTDNEIGRNSIEGFAAGGTSIYAHSLYDLRTGDYIYVQLWQDSGAALNSQVPGATNDQRFAYFYALREGI